MQPTSDLLAHTDKLKAELDAQRPLPREVEDRVLQKFRLWWTYHSNAIEGNSLTQGETEMFLMEGLTAKGKPFKDHLDIKGHHNAINFLLAMVREKAPVTEADIRKLHEVLLVEPYLTPAQTPDGQDTRKQVAVGEYKSTPNHVRTPTGEMHYYASPLDTPPRMQALVEKLRQDLDERKQHPLSITAWLHHEFTAIHPFDDGNGRMARLLTNLLLMQEGYPPVVIRKEERNAYIAALREADQGDLSALTSFLAEHVEASLSLYLQAARGEEIHEPNDLEKEIALLAQSFHHVEDPPELSPEVQSEVLHSTIRPIFGEIARLTLPLAALYTSSVITVSDFHGNRHATYDNISTPFTEAGSFALPRFLAENSGILFSLSLESFKKQPLHNVDVQNELRVRFEKLCFSLEVSRFQPPYSQKFSYADRITADQIERIAQAFVQPIVGQIKEKSGIPT